MPVHIEKYISICYILIVMKKISSIMSKDLVTLGQRETLISAIQKMSLKNVSSVVVIKKKIPVGIVTERDIVYLIAKKIDVNTVRLQNVMKSPIIAIPEETDISEAATLMVLNNLRRLLVLDISHNVVGIVTQTDIIKSLHADSFINLKKVSDVMSKEIISVSPDDSVSKAVSLMSKFRKSCVLVLQENKPIGIITERNITKAIVNDSLNKSAKEVMTPSSIAIKRDINLYEASKLMDKNYLRSLPIIDERGDAIGVITMTDIITNLRFDYIETLRNMMKERDRFLTESEAKFKTLIEQSLEGVIIVQDEIIKFVNPTLLKFLGYNENEIINNEIFKFLYPESRELLLECFKKMQRNEVISTPIELHMMQKNNEEIYMEAFLNLIEYEGQPSVIMTTRDISDRKIYESELKRLVITDDLTGLYNQRFFLTEIIKEIERAKRHKRKLSLLFIDIDDFKSFNDSYGHWEGDYVLKKFAELIKKNVRDIDMVCRYGGEEFVILLPETSKIEAFDVAERIRATVGRHNFHTYTLDGSPAEVTRTVSIGVAELEANDNMETFLKRADRAMFQAKMAGKNKVVCI